MTDNLVKRLRNFHSRNRHSDREEAADRIEHLEARVLLLKASVHNAWDIIDLFIGLKAKEANETLEESKND